MSVLSEVKEVKKHSFIKIISILLLITFLAGVGIYYKYFKDTKIINKITYIVGTGDIKTSVPSDGKIIGDSQYTISFPINGTIKNVYKKAGDKIKKGEKIADIDDKYLKLELQKAQIELKVAQSNLNAKIQAISPETLNTAKINLDYQLTQIETSKKELENKKILLQKTLDTAKTLYDNTQKDLITEKTNLDLINQDETNKISNLSQTLNQKVEILKIDINKYGSRIQS